MSEAECAHSACLSPTPGICADTAVPPCDGCLPHARNSRLAGANLPKAAVLQVATTLAAATSYAASHDASPSAGFLRRHAEPTSSPPLCSLSLSGERPDRVRWSGAQRMRLDFSPLVPLCAPEHLISPATHAPRHATLMAAAGFPPQRAQGMPHPGHTAWSPAPYAFSLSLGSAVGKLFAPLLRFFANLAGASTLSDPSSLGLPRFVGCRLSALMPS